MDYKILKIHKKIFFFFCKLFFFWPPRPCCRAVCAQPAPRTAPPLAIVSEGTPSQIFFPALIKYSININYINTTKKILG